MWEPNYVTAAELRAYVERGSGIDLAEMVGDDVAYFDRLAATASRIVDAHCRRQFGKVDTPEARVYESDGARLHIDDLMDAADMTVAIDGVLQATPSGGWSLWPFNAPAKGAPWTRLRLSACDGTMVAVTARWGWSTVPDAVVTATLLQAHRLAIRKDSPYGIAGGLAEGSDLRLLARIDPDVKVTLAPYRRTESPL